MANILLRLLFLPCAIYVTSTSLKGCVYMFWLSVVLIVFGLIGVLRSRAIRQEKGSIDDFWNREEQSNSIRKQDISQLEYITIPLDNLPMEESNDTKVAEYQRVVRDLAGYDILNLTGISNTDLKLQYGPANLEVLSLADSRFTTLARTLANWGARLYELGDIEGATKVLEFGIDCKSDVRATYSTLARIYKASRPDEIGHLIDVASSLNSLTKDSIISELKEIAAA